jgi:hypothetical protein
MKIIEAVKRILELLNCHQNGEEVSDAELEDACEALAVVWWDEETPPTNWHAVPAESRPYASPVQEYLWAWHGDTAAYHWHGLGFEDQLNELKINEATFYARRHKVQSLLHTLCGPDRLERHNEQKAVRIRVEVRVNGYEWENTVNPVFS